MPSGCVHRELGFERVFVLPYPRDDGIAVGCCAYSLFGNGASRPSDPSEELSGEEPPSSSPSEGEELERPAVWSQPFLPYLGIRYTDAQIRATIESDGPWLDV